MSKPFLDFSTTEEVQKSYLVLFGLFIIIPTAFISTFASFIITQNSTMALVGGFSTMLVVGGALGYFTVIIRQAVQQVQIKVVQQ